MAPDGLVEVRVSAPDAETAQALASSAVAARLAACGQVIGPMTSTYVWKGSVATEQEHLLLLKTTAAGFEALRAHVAAAHPYETPEILAVPVSAADEGYAAWVRECVGG